MAVIWSRSHRADPPAVAIADRHYNRQKVGTPQFVPPGRCLVLKAPDAVWVTSWPKAEYVKHAWAGAWVNTMFRREAGPLASEMIREAIAWTVYEWSDVPTLGLISFVDAEKVKHKRDPGRCYIRAGFTLVGESKGGLLCFQMLPNGIRNIAIDEQYAEIATMRRYQQGVLL